MKASYNTIHKVLSDYLKTKDLTALCKGLKSYGIVKQIDICNLFEEHYTAAYLNRKKTSAYTIAYILLNTDLDVKIPYNPDKYIPMSFVEEMKREKNAGLYKKILFEGGSHIWWCSPIYGHKDYNKSIWRANTPENRAKMRIINNYLNK